MGERACFYRTTWKSVFVEGSGCDGDEAFLLQVMRIFCPAAGEDVEAFADGMEHLSPTL